MMKNSVSYWAQRLGLGAIIVMALSMPLSRAVFNLSAALMVIAWLASGQYKTLPLLLKSNGALALIAVLFAWTSLSAVYSPVEPWLAWNGALNYTKLLFIPIIVSFLQSDHAQRSFEKSMMVGLMVLVVAYCLSFFISVPGSRIPFPGADIGVFNNYIVEGFSITCLTLWSLYKAFTIYAKDRLMQALFLVIALIGGYLVLWVNPSRSAMLALCTGLLGLALMLPSRRIKQWILLSMIVTLTGVVTQSQMLSSRFQTAFHEFQQAAVVKNTSVGLRVNAWKASWALSKEAPIIGHGAATYSMLMFAQKQQEVGGCQDNPVCLQPHNQYLFFLVEQGAIGLFLFISLLVSIAFLSFKQISNDKGIAFAFVSAFAVYAFFDSSFKMGTQMFIFVIFTSLIVARSQNATKRRLDGLI